MSSASQALLQDSRERPLWAEYDLMILGQRAGLSMLRENSPSLCYRQAAIRGRYAIKGMEKHTWHGSASPPPSAEGPPIL